MVLAIADFVKTFDSVWYSTLLSKLLSLLVILFVLSNGPVNLISEIALRKSVSIILIIVIFAFLEVSLKAQFLSHIYGTNKVVG